MNKELLNIAVYIGVCCTIIVTKIHSRMSFKGKAQLYVVQAHTHTMVSRICLNSPMPRCCWEV